MPSKGDDTESEATVTTRRTALRLGLSGIVASTIGTTTTAAQEAGTEEWAFSPDDYVRSSPTVISGTVFVGSADGTLHAVDAETGTEQWAFESGSAILQSSPTVVDGTVFIGNTDGTLYAVDAETGTEQWAFETGSQVRSSPTVTNGTVFVGSWDSNLYAVDAETGTEEWAFETGDRVDSSPTVVDGTVFVGSGGGSPDDTNLYAVDAETGTEQWAFETGGSVISSPTVADGTVFVGSDDSNLYAVDAETGTEEWAFETGRDVWSSPTVVDETVFVGSLDGNLYAVDAEMGTEQWTFETDAGVFSSPTVVDGTVFVGSGEVPPEPPDDTNLYAVDAETGTEQWAFETGWSVRSSPTVVDGTVFVGSGDNTLYAVNTGVSGSSEDSRAMLGTLGHHDEPDPEADTNTEGTEAGTDTGEEVESGPEITSIHSRLEVIFAGIGVSGLVAGYAGWRYVSADDTTTEEADDAPTAADSTVASATEPEQTVHDERTTAESAQSAAAQLVEKATTAQSNQDFGTSVDSYRAALEKYQTALEVLGAGATEQRSEIENAVESTRADLEAVKSQREAYQRAESQLQAAETSITTAETELDDGNAQHALEQFETASERLDIISSSIQEYNFDGLADQLEELQNQCQRGRNKAKEMLSSSSTTGTIPETIPSPPKLSLTYDAIKKGDPIGSGGNADVYRATATTESSEVELALKEPRMSGTIDTSTIDQMLTEAETWQQLDDHDHIVSVVDYGSDPLPWIAMEYMDGENLADRAGELDFEQALWTAISITKAVRHAHRRGIAHLDLKPANILFGEVADAWDVPKVGDWGLSKHLLQHSKSVEGMSPHYAAPEQFDEDFGSADDITDIYQLGTVFYQLFTGQPPFEGQTYRVMDKIKNEDPIPPSDIVDVPPELDDILLTALAKDKADRYETVVYFRDELQELWDERH